MPAGDPGPSCLPADLELQFASCLSLWAEARRADNIAKLTSIIRQLSQEIQHLESELENVVPSLYTAYHMYSEIEEVAVSPLFGSPPNKPRSLERLHSLGIVRAAAIERVKSGASIDRVKTEKSPRLLKRENSSDSLNSSPRFKEEHTLQDHAGNYESAYEAISIPESSTEFAERSSGTQSPPPPPPRLDRYFSTSDTGSQNACSTPSNLPATPESHPRLESAYSVTSSSYGYFSQKQESSGTSNDDDTRKSYDSIEPEGNSILFGEDVIESFRKFQDEEGPETNEETARNKRDFMQKQNLQNFIHSLREQDCNGHAPQNPWLLQYFTAFHLPDGPLRRAKLTQYYDSFVQEATTIGNIILSDLIKPSRFKRIPAAKLGGIAGGDKFKANGIIFKLATDPRVEEDYLYGANGIFPDYALSSKSAGSELRGVNSYFEFFYQHSIPVYLPTSVLLDAAGFRIVAMPELPLRGGKIVYGSNNAGRTVHADLPALNAVMQAAGIYLHLADHYVGGKLLSSAGDVESHIGHDGRLYLLDLGRTYPPEYTIDTKHILPMRENSVFFRFLRPELLQKWKKLGMPAVSPDVFSGWSNKQPDMNVHNTNAIAITRHLLNVCLPELAAHLSQQLVEDKADLSRFVQPWLDMNPDLRVGLDGFVKSWVARARAPNFDGAGFANDLSLKLWEMWQEIGCVGANPTLLAAPNSLRRHFNILIQTLDLGAACHRQGVPVRLLGGLRSLLNAQPLKQACLLEMTKRSLKNLLRQRIREAQARKFDVTRLVASFLRTVTVCNAKGDSEFWSQDVPAVIISNFGPGAFSKEEEAAGVGESLCNSIVCVSSIASMVKYVCQRTGVRDVSALSVTQIQPAAIFFEAHVKSLSFFDSIKAQTLLDNALETDNLESMLIYVTQAREICSKLQRTDPSNEEITKLESACALIQVLGCQKKPKTDADFTELARAFATYVNEECKCMSSSSSTPPVWVALCVRACTWMENEARSALMNPSAQTFEDPRIVLRLIELKASVEGRGKKGDLSPLYLACRAGHSAVALALIQANAVLGDTMEAAAYFGLSEVVKTLIEAKCDPNKPSGGFPPLYVACQNGHEEVARVLLARNADVNYTYKDGSSALYMACQHGHSKVASFLITQKAMIDRADKAGLTPLWAAGLGEHCAVVELLVSNGANPLHSRQDGLSLLDHACQEGLLELAALLIPFCPNINLPDKGGNTPLFHACLRSRLPLAELLLSKGADVNQTDKDGNSLLYATAAKGLVPVVEFLLSHDADPNKGGSTPLFAASQQGHIAVVRALLAYPKVALDQLCQGGETALFVAAFKGFLPVVSALVMRGAIVDKQCTNGASPLFAANFKGHTAVSKYLLSKGAKAELVNEVRDWKY